MSTAFIEMLGRKVGGNVATPHGREWLRKPANLQRREWTRISDNEVLKTIESEVTHLC